jgi:hypothetical protein
VSAAKNESYELFVVNIGWPDLEGAAMWTNNNRARCNRSRPRFPATSATNGNVPDQTPRRWRLSRPTVSLRRGEHNGAAECRNRRAF